MSKQIYILNYLRQPEFSAISLDGESMDPKGKEVWRPSGLSNLGIKLLPISLIYEQGPAAKLFGIEIRGGEQDDEFAQRFADATVAALILGERPIDPDFPIAFGVPFDKLSEDGQITFNHLLEEDAQKDYKERYGESGLFHLFGIGYILLADEIAVIWKIVQALLSDSHIFDAAHFYWASVHEFSFLGDGVREVIDDINAIPVSRYVLSRAENAVLNAFKAIEALIGNPPQDDGRLRKRIEAAGLDPDEQVGFSGYGLTPGSIFDKVRKLSRARDKRAAHGRTAAKHAITYYEIMDAQQLALTFIFASIEKCLGELQK